MKRTIDEIESCRPGLGLPAGAEQTLTAFHRARELLQPIQELQQLSVEQNTTLRVCRFNSVFVFTKESVVCFLFTELECVFTYLVHEKQISVVVFHTALKC